MNTLKHILSRYTAFLWAILQPLGAWGVFAVAALDGAAVGLPMDVVVGGYVALDHKRFLLYVLMAAAGSALCRLVIFPSGYAVGGELLRERGSARRLETIHPTLVKQPFLRRNFPPIQPPPPP